MTVINDETFYNILGEAVSRAGLVQRLIDYYHQKLEVGETSVTDFNEGSEIRNLLEAICVDLYYLMSDQYELSKIAFITTAYGEWLDLHGENPLLNCPRETGSEAVGLLTFSIPSVLTSDFIIPEGTVVSNDDTGLEYVTDSEAYIIAGETSVEVFGTCLTVGEDGNCGVNTITIVDDDYIDSSVSVTNTDIFTGGVDYEDDDTYRERLLEAYNKDTFGSLPYYRSLAENIDGVHDVIFVNENGYTKKIIVNGSAKPTPDSVLIDVLTAFTQEENIILNHTFTVGCPSYTTVDMTVNLSVLDELDENTINECLNCFFNGGITDDYLEFQGLNIGESLTKRALYNCLEQLDGVDEVEVLISGSEISTVECGSTSVLKLGTVTINQTGVD